MPQIISKNSFQPTELTKQSLCSHNKCILISILLLVVGIVGGFYLGISGIFPNSSQNPTPTTNQAGQPASDNTVAVKGTYEDGYKSGLDFARKKLQGKGAIPVLAQFHNISNATVKSVNANELVIEFDSSKLDIFSEGTMTKTVKISETTKIEKHTQKSSEEMKMDTADLQKKSQEDQKSTLAPIVVTPPFMISSPFKTETLKLSDLKPGDTVSVTSASDITKSDTFDATSVILVPAPKAPQMLNQPPVNTVPPAAAPVPLPDSEVGNIPVQPETLPSDSIGVMRKYETQPPAPNAGDTTTTNTAEKPAE